ncbi:MAG: hypothetical protein ACRCTP_04310 [Aeromonas popoffii]|uniref:hypothetical protein n=1 Tax=Aeromonas popoffii TaxID=70856 RepID=UPI003F406DD9
MLNESAFVEIEQILEPLLLTEGADVEVGILLESLDSAPYALEKKVVKGKGDISYIFADETGDRYRIQFLTGAKLGKGVAKVYVGKAKSEKLFVDKIDRFANPRAMISTITSLFSEHLLTPEGMALRGFVVDLSGAAATRAIPLMKKVINSTLRSKVKVVDGEYDPVPNRKYIWVTKATLKPAEVFNGEGVGEDAPWMKGVERKGSQATLPGKDGKAAPFDPMVALQELANGVKNKLKGQYPKIEIRPSYNAQGKVGMLTPYIQGTSVGGSAIFSQVALKNSPNVDDATKVIKTNIQAADDLKAKKLAEIMEEKKRTNQLASDPYFYLNSMKPELEKQINKVYPNLNLSVSFKDASREHNLAKVVLSIDGVKVGDASVLLFGEDPASAMESIRVSIRKEDWARATKEVSDSKIKTTTQTADGKVAKTLGTNAKKMIDVGMKDVKLLADGLVSFKHPEFGVLVATFNNDGKLVMLASGWDHDSISPRDSDYILQSLKAPGMVYAGRAVQGSRRAEILHVSLVDEVRELRKKYPSLKIEPVEARANGGAVSYALKANAPTAKLNGFVRETIYWNKGDDGSDSKGESSDGRTKEPLSGFTKGLIIPTSSLANTRDFETVLGHMKYSEDYAIQELKKAAGGKTTEQLAVELKKQRLTILTELRKAFPESYISYDSTDPNRYASYAKGYPTVEYMLDMKSVNGSKADTVYVEMRTKGGKEQVSITAYNTGGRKELGVSDGLDQASIAKAAKQAKAGPLGQVFS